MSTHLDHIKCFLELKRIAVAGVSGSKSPANAIYNKFMQAGYDVIPVNPHIKDFEGKTCYPSVSDIQPLPEGVFLFTNAEVTEKITQECIKFGIKYIWMHNMMGILSDEATSVPDTSSVSLEAVKRAKEAGMIVIAGSCPMQFIPPVDFFHTCVHWICDKTGKLD